MAPADRDRWLALGLLLAALALAYALLVHPWWTVPMLEANDRIESLQQRELRQRMQLRQAPLVRERLQRVQQELAGRPGFLQEASTELATVGLVQRLETAVAQASPGNRSCAITNRSPVTDTTRERYARVVVQVRLRCGTGELATVLHSLEGGTPRLFVGNLNVLAQRHFFGASGEPTGEGGLDVSFDLYGYLRPGADTSAPATRPPGASTGEDDAL
ncbi:MAG: General secretion pathway protein M [uncultured Lysobacter sp.]|uniref:General secretion pathway protein M n=1 Tax=uncultured Lysobacter sp. TaxID=271060 RepID=A0A6J4L8U2_9GAMM|nr:MAG: General secretion pathway protein M [uncultured Lysobacter sp.]